MFIQMKCKLGTSECTKLVNTAHIVSISNDVPNSGTYVVRMSNEVDYALISEEEYRKLEKLLVKKTIL